MMNENEPFLANTGRSRKWKVWDCFFYLILFTPIVLLLVASQSFILGHQNNEIQLIPVTSNHNNPLGFPSTIKGVGKPYDYDSLPVCADLKWPKKLNATVEWRKMKECGFSLLQRFFGNPEGVLPNFASVLYVCDDTVEMNGFEVRELTNSKRSHYVALPKCKDDENTLINLGIDEDITAEQQLKHLVKNMKMFGTSPTGINNTFYEHVFAGSIGKDEGSINMNISNVETAVQVTSLEKYLTTELKEKRFVDILWINLSNGPFELHNYLSKDNLFDTLKLEICQIGVEVKSDEHRTFYSLMLVVLNQWTHLFLRPTMSDDGQFVRVVLVNVANERCFKKYIL